MKYTVKNVKSFIGREGYGYSCTLCKDGKKIGTVTDTANGGEVDLYLDSRELEQELRDYMDNLPEVTIDGITFPPSVDMFLESLVAAFEQAKQMVKWCKTSWVYKQTNSEKFLLFKKSIPQAIIEAKYAGRLAECMN